MARTKRTEPTAGIADQLRRHLDETGLTSYALAQLAGVDQSQVARFRAGLRDLTLDTAGKLCAALEVDLVRRKGRTPAYLRRHD